MAHRNPKITEEIKLFIIGKLALFESPSNTAAMVKEEFGLELARQTIENHDPTKVSGLKLAKKWVDIFHDTRKKYVEDMTTVPVAHKKVRVEILEKLMRQAEKKGNAPLVASLLEQISKEMGDAYTNRHRLEHTGANGAPIATTTIDAKKLSPAALKEYANARVKSD